VSQPSRRRIPLLGWVGAAVLAVTLAAVSLGLHSPGSGAIDDGQHGAPTRVVTFGFVDVRDGPTPVYPPLGGRIVAVYVKENDPVLAKDPKHSVWWRGSKGTPLFALDDRQAREKLAQARADLAAARDQVRQAQEQVEKHKRAVAAQKLAGEAREAEAAAADKELADLQFLLDQKSIRETQFLAGKAKAAAAHKAADAEKAKTAVLEAIDPTVGVALAEEQVAAKEAQLRQARLGVDECVIRAPGDGIVLRVSVTVGTVHGPTAPQPAMIFCPAGPRIIRAEVDQEWAARVSVGQRAVIQDDSRSGPTWNGKVVHLSPWFTHRRSMVLEPLQFNDIRTLEAIIELDKDENLRIGQRMKVTLEPRE
jgi:multidrug resistance efflux pump